MNRSATLLVTGSSDKTLFFFSNKDNKREPIGFVTLPASPTHISWTPAEYSKSCLLVCMEDGSVYEFEEPVPGRYDTSKTYFIGNQVQCRKYKFTSIKSRLRHEEELERIRIEEQEKHDEENRLRKMRGQPTIEEEEAAKRKKKLKKDGSSNQESVDDAEGEEKKEEEVELPAEEQAEEKKEDQWKPYIPEVASKVCWAQYSSPDTFWVSMDSYDAGYLYECRFTSEADKAKMSMTVLAQVDEPFKSTAVMQSDLTSTEDIPLSCMVFE